MKRTKINPISAKQELEIARRRALKYELFISQKGQCAQCHKVLSYRNEAADNYPHLSHKKPLGKGGKTTEKNCSVLCAECHSNKEHNLRNIYNE